MSRLEYQTYLLKHARKQNKGAGYTQDSERLKTYRAEWEFQRKFDIPKFETIEDARKFAKKIYKSKTWQKLWEEGTEKDISRIFAVSPKVVAKARSTGRGTAGFTNGYTVTLDSIAGFDAYTLIHELSHCLGHMHHGRSFRKTLVALVSRFLGREAKNILTSEFRKSKLAFGEERQPLSYEQWMSARERMDKIREKL